eukprot:scaffold59703_cov72-Phaeocystis_antarctica.AAC.2
MAATRRQSLHGLSRGAFGGPSLASLTACTALPPRQQPSPRIPTLQPCPDICLCRARRTKRSSCWCWAQRLSNACR